MFDLISEIGQTIRNNKLRTGLTGFAVAWGIFMLIVLLGLSRGLSTGYEDMMSKYDNNVIEVYQGSTSKPYKGYKEGRRIQLDASDVDALMLSGDPYIGVTMSEKDIDTAKVAGPKDYVSQGLYGLAPESQRNERIKLVAGRFINRADMDGRRKVMVISRNTAKTIFGTDSADLVVGQRVRSLGLSWKVIGLYTREWGETYNYIPITTAIALSGGHTKVWTLSVAANNVTDEASANAAEDAVRHQLARIHNFDPDDRAATPMWNRFTSYLRGKSGHIIIDYAMWVIGIFSLLSGIVGVSNIMFVSVRERTHEIGIRRAIGAKRRDILKQVITESVVITTVFGYIGIVGGMAVMQAVNYFIENSEAKMMLGSATVDISMAVNVTLVLIIAGALAGLFPALNATKVKPVEALRDE